MSAALSCAAIRLRPAAEEGAWQPEDQQQLAGVDFGPALLVEVLARVPSHGRLCEELFCSLVEHL